MRHVNALSGIADDDDPWCDLVLDIVRDKRGTAGLFSRNGRLLEIEALGSIADQDNEIGIGVSLPLEGWDAKRIDDDFTVYWGRIGLFSIGQPTIELIRLYKRWFGDQTPTPRVMESADLLAVSLSGDPAVVAEKGLLQTKVFFDTGSENASDEEYSELFVNFDLPERRLELHEKDPDYRKGLVGWLSGRYPTIETRSQA